MWNKKIFSCWHAWQQCGILVNPFRLRVLWSRSAAVLGQRQIFGCDGSCCCCRLQTCPNCIVLAAFPPLTRVHRPSNENWKLLAASSNSSRISPCFFQPVCGHNITLCYVLRSVYIHKYMHAHASSLRYGFAISMYVHISTLCLGQFCFSLVFTEWNSCGANRRHRSPHPRP